MVLINNHSLVYQLVILIQIHIVKTGYLLFLGYYLVFKIRIYEDDTYTIIILQIIKKYIEFCIANHFFLCLFYFFKVFLLSYFSYILSFSKILSML